jgi:hypothetical protein
VASLTQDEAVSLFVTRFPGLEEKTQRFFRDWNSNAKASLGGHYVWVDILFHEVMYPLLGDEPENVSGLVNFFGVLEELSTRGEQRTLALVCDGILERIGDSPEWLTRARAYMGPTTRRLSDEVEQNLGRTWG